MTNSAEFTELCAFYIPKMCKRYTYSTEA